MANQNINDQEQHYKSLIDLFKYCVTFAGILFTLIAFVVGYITYKDGQEMRNEQKEARKEIRDNLKEMKGEIREERERMEQKATQARVELAEREKELLTKQAELEGSVGRLLVSTNRDIASTRGEALRQIAGVKNEATTIARSEAKNRINQVFKEKNLDQFIETVAKDKLGPKVQTLVDEQFKEFGGKLENQINDAQLLSQLTGGIITLESAYPIIILDSLSRHTKNASIRQSARREIGTYVEILDEQWIKEKRNDKYYKLTGDSLAYSYLKEYAPKYATRPLPSEQVIIKAIFETTIKRDGPMDALASGFALFNRLTGKKIGWFDFAALEKEYANYQNQRYPLKMKGR